MKMLNTQARKSSGLTRLATAAAVLLVLTFATSAVLAGDGLDTTSSPVTEASLIRFFDSPQHPLPLMSVIVRQLKTAQEVDDLVLGKSPSVMSLLILYNVVLCRE